MHRSGEHVLADPCFSDQRDTDVRLNEAFERVEHVVHRAGSGYGSAEVTNGADIRWARLGRREPATAEGPDHDVEPSRLDARAGLPHRGRRSLHWAMMSVMKDAVNPNVGVEIVDVPRPLKSIAGNVDSRVADSGPLY
jgi:hypothetical protein